MFESARCGQLRVMAVPTVDCDALLALKAVLRSTPGPDAEVCLGKVGAVALREVSRFARNSREWQQLVEVCRVVDTVLIDLETVYSPRHSNDHLLLGLKGSLNEYELDLLRQRSVEARRAKAGRGELLVAAAVGYVKTDAPHFKKDPEVSRGVRRRRTPSSCRSTTISRSLNSFDRKRRTASCRTRPSTK